MEDIVKLAKECGINDLKIIIGPLDKKIIAEYKLDTIYVNEYFLRKVKNNRVFWVEVLLHEYAHYVCGGENHDENFKETFEDLSGEILSGSHFTKKKKKQLKVNNI